MRNTLWKTLAVSATLSHPTSNSDSGHLSLVNDRKTGGTAAAAWLALCGLRSFLADVPTRTWNSFWSLAGEGL